MELRGYGKVYGLGHKAIAALFDDPVVIEEKIDGSQFAFGLLQAEEGGEYTLHLRSRRQTIHPEAPPKDFAGVTKTVLSLVPSLVEGWTYRGEVLARPHHNCLSYERVPAGNVIIFDIDQGMEDFLDPIGKEEEAHRLGLECVPLIPVENPRDLDALKAILETPSCLGGTTIEGVVFKSLTRFDRDGKCLKGKYVSEAFKEKNAHAWKAANPRQGDVVQQVIDTYRTDARWLKAVAHMRDAGTLTDEPKDIGPLMRDLAVDFEEECSAEVMAFLWKWCRKDVLRGIQRDFPSWYKERLAAQQFGG